MRGRSLTTDGRMIGLQRLKHALPVLIVSVLVMMNGCASLSAGTVTTESPPLVFKEIWGYLIQGRESDLKGTEPFTDICYFSASLTKEGRITETIARPSITTGNGSKPRIFLVIAELTNSALLHFSLSPSYGLRPQLINDICRVSADFDGVQIDFEAVSADDAQAFWDFLQELKSQLPPGKMLSIALPPRTAPKPDAYSYVKIAPIVDRVMIMAYNEHWGGSSPGPVASLPWCSEVLTFAQSVIPVDKLIMGLPLYGRVWMDKKIPRALGYDGVQSIMTEKNAKTSYESDLGPNFQYSENVVVSVYYDDVRSLREKLLLYESRNVTAVAFWRIGLSPSELWSSVSSAPAVGMPTADQVSP
jgi:spore germination protein YaaH